MATTQDKPQESRTWRHLRVKTAHMRRMAPAVCLMLLCGCQAPANLDTGRNLIERRDEALVGSPNAMDPGSLAIKPHISLSPGVGGESSSAVSISSGASIVPSGQESDYIDKADVYWKLNWIRQRLLYGALPHDLARMVARTRTELMTTRRDSNFELGSHALTHLEAGVRHWKAEREIESVSLHAITIPWRTGTDTMERFLANGGLGFGGRSSTDMSPPLSGNDPNLNGQAPQPPELGTLTTEQKHTVELVRLYAEQLHSSPEAEMTREWRLAILSINALRDGLGLQNRRENSDGDFSEPGVASRQTTVDDIDKVFPTSDGAATGRGDRHALDLPDPSSDPFGSDHGVEQSSPVIGRP